MITLVTAHSRETLGYSFRAQPETLGYAFAPRPKHS